jgi:hypothetical protein
MHYEIFRAAAAAPKGGRCLPRSLRWKAKESAAEAKKKIVIKKLKHFFEVIRKINYLKYMITFFSCNGQHIN